MTAIKPHLSPAELEHRYETAVEPIAKSHFHALWLLSQNYDIEETAEILSFSRGWVLSLIKRYNEGGPERLGDQRVHNATEPSILTPAGLEVPANPRSMSPPEIPATGRLPEPAEDFRGADARGFAATQAILLPARSLRFIR